MEVKQMIGAVWVGFAKGFRQGAREAVRGYWAPLRVRYWKFAAREMRRGGWRAMASALFHRGYTLVSTDRLDAEGRPR